MFRLQNLDIQRWVIDILFKKLYRLLKFLFETMPLHIINNAFFLRVLLSAYLAYISEVANPSLKSLTKSSL